MILFFRIYSCSSKYYYKAPQFDLKNPNITFAFTAYADQGYDFVPGYMFAAVCQADKINQGLAVVDINGTINLIAQAFLIPDNSSQQATMSLFENNLYNYSTNEPAYGNNSIPIGGFFGFLGTGSLQINSAITNGYLFPFVFAGTQTSLDPDNNFIGSSPSDNKTAFQIRDSVVYNSFLSVLDLLEYFNWTLVGNIYQDNSYGYTMQQNVQIFQSKSFLPNFACSEIFSTDIAFNLNGEFDATFSRFCSCVEAKAKISVIVLWMTSTLASETMIALHSRCPASKEWTFIITNDVAYDFDYAYSKDIMKNSLILRQFGEWNFNEFMQDCLNNASAEAEPILKELSDQLFTSYLCLEPNNSTLYTEYCPEDVSKRNSTCICIGTEVENDAYTVIFISLYKSLINFSLNFSLRLTP